MRGTAQVEQRNQDQPQNRGPEQPLEKNETQSQRLSPPQSGSTISAVARAENEDRKAASTRCRYNFDISPLPTSARTSGLPPLNRWRSSSQCRRADNRADPDRSEHADDEKAEVAEVSVQRRNPVPKPTRRAELVAYQAERLDAADQESDDDGNEGDRKVVGSVLRMPSHRR